MDILSFNYWVCSQDARGIFQVQISRTETVAAPQKAIKNEKLGAFRDVDANALPLYRPRTRVQACPEGSTTVYD